MKKTYCIKCTSLMFLQKRAVCDSKKLKFIKNQEGSFC